MGGECGVTCPRCGSKNKTQDFCGKFFPAGENDRYHACLDCNKIYYEDKPNYIDIPMMSYRNE